MWYFVIKLSYQIGFQVKMNNSLTLNQNYYLPSVKAAEYKETCSQSWFL